MLPDMNQMTPPVSPAGDQYGPFGAQYYYLYGAQNGPVKDQYGVPDGYANAPEPGLGLDLLLEQKKELVGYKLELLSAELYQRRDIKERNLYRMDLDQCEFKNMILLRGEDIWDKYRFKLEEQILRLEEEKRKEEAGYFRDVFWLKKEMRESLLESREERHKAALLMY